MFDAYVNQDENRSKRRRWLGIVVAGSIFAHVVVVIALVVAGMWKVEKNTLKDKDDILVRTWHAGVVAPPPLGKATVKQRKKKPLIRKRLVKDLRQPTKQRASIKIDTSDTGGDGPGRPDGKIGGTGHDPNAQVTSLTACQPGEVCGPGIPNVPKIAPPKLPPARPKIVSANMIAGSRLSGTARILPPERVKVQIANDDKQRVVGAMIMCLNTRGGVSKVRVVKSTGYNAYDQKILRKMRQWRYRPYKVNGTSVPVCTSITFIYRQSR